MDLIARAQPSTASWTLGNIDDSAVPIDMGLEPACVVVKPVRTGVEIKADVGMLA